MNSKKQRNRGSTTESKGRPMNMQEAIMERFDALNLRLDDLSDQINGKVNPMAMMTVKEVAKELRVHECTVRRMVAKGDLKPARYNKRNVMFPVCEVNRVKGIKPITFF